MKKAVRGDKQLVMDLLCKSFDRNQSVNYIIKQDKKRQGRIAILMDYSFELCFRFGEVYLSDDNRGCALILYPQNKKTTLDSIWLDLKLAVNAIGITRIGKALRRESKIKSRRPNKPMAYLWFIGVDPMYQHQMIGSRLLQEVITHANKSGLPVYLETSTERNLPWYESLGFQSYDTLDINYILHFLCNNSPEK